jgi:hypothetical protein
MIRVGVTGHQALPVNGLGFISQRIDDYLTLGFSQSPLTGVTSLAAGADQLFADLVLKRGGVLEAVIPSKGYESTFNDVQTRRHFDFLLRQAARVEVLEYEWPSEEAFFAGGKRVVSICDELIAVWDGLPSRGHGGTADVVAYAQSIGKPVRVIWPAGVNR